MWLLLVCQRCWGSSHCRYRWLSSLIRLLIDTPAHLQVQSARSTATTCCSNNRIHWVTVWALEALLRFLLNFGKKSFSSQRWCLAKLSSRLTFGFVGSCVLTTSCGRAAGSRDFCLLVDTIRSLEPNCRRICELLFLAANLLRVESYWFSNEVLARNWINILNK